MYKVLVADDEYVIRQSISTRIPWKKMGYFLAGTCENGKEAVEILEREKIDVVLTDISMPYMDGLALAKYIHENCPKTKTIIISCYDEFEYAKQALRCQVFSYIIKPITAKEMIETLGHVKRVLDEENLEDIELFKMRSAFEENYAILRNQFLLETVSGKLTKEDIIRGAKKFHLQFDDIYYACAEVQIEDAVETDIHSVIEVTTRILSESENGVVFRGAEENILILFSGNKKHSFMYKAMETCESILKYAMGELHVNVSIFLGKEEEGIDAAVHSLEEARRVRAYQFMMNENCFLYSEDFKEGDILSENQIDTIYWKNELTLAIRSHLEPEIRKLVHNFCKTMKEKNLPKNRVILLLQNIILAVVHIADVPGIESDELYNEEYKLVAQLGQCKYLMEAEEKVLQFCLLTTECLNRNREGTGKKQAMMALDYIEKNYANCELSLQMVCNYLSISVSYFSSIFKDYTNETFVEALTRVRVEKAKELFDLTSMKAYEVASAVGYNDAHYFSAVFKRIAGITPTDYARGKDA